MLRQLRNLRRYGRLRTNGTTSRTGKPSFLRRHPDVEFTDYLDLATTRYCRPADAFFFVQIGAFDGRAADPLNHLIMRHGWRGILVEPQADAFERLKETYSSQPQLRFFNVAVGPRDESITFYTRKSGAVLHAGIHSTNLISPGHGRGEIVAHEVDCWTLNTLLANARVREPIDLLQIDAEGADHAIVHSIDFGRVRPTIVRFEHVLMSARQKSECLAFLAEHGYRFIVEEADTLAVLAEA